jgi:hypothetical protein
METAEGAKSLRRREPPVAVKRRNDPRELLLATPSGQLLCRISLATLTAHGL